MMKGAIKLELARLRDMTHVEWEYWEADLVPGGFWARMAPDAVIALEAAAAGARASAKSFFRNERTGKETLYEYDLDKMEQLNTETKFRRTIRLTPALRRSASVQASASPPPPKHFPKQAPISVLLLLSCPNFTKLVKPKSS